ncbi:MAG TPA: hypothetical protein VHX65_16940, partial [Pirellulales bacterium]|nr:hypothetical protein [Pirellulales bacterium]
MSRWKKLQIKITTLELDPLNPRIPALVESPSQRDIVANLVAHEDVYELAKSVVDFGGLYPNESLIAIEENGNKIVVEGNRRLAALNLNQASFPRFCGLVSDGDSGAAPPGKRSMASRWRFRVGCCNEVGLLSWVRSRGGPERPDS